MAKILPQIDHIVVVMFENRSLDNMCGWLYSDPTQQPATFLPVGSSAEYNGLQGSFSNPQSVAYFAGGPSPMVTVSSGSSSFTNPMIDPEETFEHVTYQLYGPDGAVSNPKYPMKGFVIDYESLAQIHFLRSWSHSVQSRFLFSPHWLAATPSPTHGFARCRAKHGPIAPSFTRARQAGMWTTVILRILSTGVSKQSSTCSTIRG
jgi:hypothetical protein